jgi:hypothetical protein
VSSTTRAGSSNRPSHGPGSAGVHE